MRTVGARLQHAAPGEVEIDLPFREDLAQHRGYVAAAVLTAIVDVACGDAAMTLFDHGDGPWRGPQCSVRHAADGP
jgi:acyl-coenzyme A thioesterase PaaI-like protein